MAYGDKSFLAPATLRERYRNLDRLVQIALETDEDPLVLAQDAGVSPSALVRLLPREHLSKFVPGADRLTVQEIVLKLASIHALDVAVGSIVGEDLDARSRVVMSRDLMDRASLVGQKVRPVTSTVSLSDQSLSKLAELERTFAQHALESGQIPKEFEAFHRTVPGETTDEKEGQNDETQGWAWPLLKDVRNLNHMLDDSEF